MATAIDLLSEMPFNRMGRKAPNLEKGKTTVLSDPDDPAVVGGTNDGLVGKAGVAATKSVAWPGVSIRVGPAAATRKAKVAKAKKIKIIRFFMTPFLARCLYNDRAA
jgi:hypothetical protein